MKIKPVKVKEVVVVPHTHWDREWYQPFQEYRIRLTKMTKELLEAFRTRPRFNAFTFDGQTIVLNDYLEIHPEDRGFITQLVKNGKLVIGPWYVLPDEFLVSGEALIRNLCIGHQIAKEFGPVMKVGYVPDPFGHISQLPQILNGFGIDSFIFTRGFPETGEKIGQEFFWIGPDGKSKVLAVRQVDGYANANRMGWLGFPWDRVQVPFSYKNAEAKSLDVLGKMKKYQQTPYALFNNGSDHLHAQPNLPEILAYLTKKLKVRFFQGHFPDYLKRVRKYAKLFAEYRGEMRSPFYNHLLPGVLSTRLYLKQKNFETLHLLEKWAEPLAALAAGVGEPSTRKTNGEGSLPAPKAYPHGLLTKAWKFTVENHPHDSICGCSIDQVHREMMPRFDQAQQIGQWVARESMAHIASQVDTRLASEEQAALLVFNPLTEERLEPFRTSIQLQADPKEEAKPSLRLVSPDGTEVPLQVVGHERRQQDQGQYAPTFDFYDVFLRPDVPSGGYTTLWVERLGKSKAAEGAFKADAKGCETRDLKVAFSRNGSFTVTHKETGKTYPDQNLLEDSGDAGDEYNFSPPFQNRVFTSSSAKAKVILASSGPVGFLYKVNVEWSLPEELGRGRKGRSPKKAHFLASFEVFIPAEGCRIEVSAQWDNRSKDHRLRVLFPAPFKTSHSSAASHFDVVDRPLAAPPWRKGPEQPRPEHPNQGWVSVSDGGSGLSVLNVGLMEFQALAWKGGTALALTLMRSVGWLSRDDMRARKGHAGPGYPTPEAQCLGRGQARYAVLYHSGNWEAAQAFRESDGFHTGFQTFLEKSHGGPLPSRHSFLASSHAEIRLSALKRDPQTGKLIVRVYNIGSQPADGRLVFANGVKAAQKVNFLEETTGPAEVALGAVRVSLAPKEIATFQVTTF